jgi:tetratricopeptide (TPR) repeat protein
MAVVRFTIALALIGAAHTLAAAPTKEPPATVVDLRYGAALYDYYQGNYWNALSQLLVADSQAPIQGHGDKPKIMEGTFSLAYGLERRASDIFLQVLDTGNDKPGSHDIAWFYLAKVRYSHGDWEGASQALANISEEPPRDYAEELHALRINVAIQQGDLSTASEWLRQQPPGESWLPYLYYNLGAAHSRAGNFRDAVSFYDHLAEIPLWTEENRTVYDRAMTAAGYTHLRNRQYAKAQAEFSRVRVDSPLSSSAMLGYGWAAAEQGDFLDALTPWEYLAQQPLVDENAQEALLAVPYAYEQLGNKGLALKHFQRATERFSSELNTIDTTLDALYGEPLVDVLQIDPSVDFNWLNRAESAQLEPQLSYLAELFSRDSFQARVQEVRDLLAIRQRLQNWQNKLDLYAAMLKEREANRETQAAYLEQHDVAGSIAKLRQQRDALARELERVQNEQDYFALATGQQAQLVERLNNVAERLDALADAGQAVDEYRESYRRYAGLLLWQASEDFSSRVWETKKQLEQLNQQIAELEQTESRVKHLVATADDLAPYYRRIAAHQQRLARQQEELNSTLASAEQQLREQVAQVLETQRERLRYYLAQSRLSVARLYDTAELEQP